MVYYIGGILLAIVLFIWMYKCWGIRKNLDKKNKELQSLYQKTEKQFQLQKDFVSILSQELRTPLYGIMGLTHLLTEEHPELENDRKLKSLKFSSDYLLNLINNVLHINYLDSGKITTKEISFDLKEISQNLINSFDYATKNSDNKLHFDFDSKIDQLIFGDPAILSQILMNMISNALRFTKNGNVKFSVDQIKKKENSCTISFKVSHDGYEITKEDQKSIYQEFINVEKAKKTYLGVGLNSQIIKRLAASIQGEVILQHDVHAGSEYVFVVDFITKHENKNETTVSKNEPKDQNLKALIVDDNKLNLLVADKILSSENFDCTTIDNGFDAIELSKNNQYDVILMDINMPKLNGIGTTKRIREFDRKTPVIALTAVDVTQLNKQIIQSGLNDYLLKPYNKSQLLEIINKYIDVPV